MSQEHNFVIYGLGILGDRANITALCEKGQQGKLKEAVDDFIKLGVVLYSWERVSIGRWVKNVLTETADRSDVCRAVHLLKKSFPHETDICVIRHHCVHCTS